MKGIHWLYKPFERHYRHNIVMSLYLKDSTSELWTISNSVHYNCIYLYWTSPVHGELQTHNTESNVSIHIKHMYKLHIECSSFWDGIYLYSLKINDSLRPQTRPEEIQWSSSKCTMPVFVVCHHVLLAASSAAYILHWINAKSYFPCWSTEWQQQKPHPCPITYTLHCLCCNPVNCHHSGMNSCPKVSLNL